MVAQAGLVLMVMGADRNATLAGGSFSPAVCGTHLSTSSWNASTILSAGLLPLGLSDVSAMGAVEVPYPPSGEAVFASSSHKLREVIVSRMGGRHGP